MAPVSAKSKKSATTAANSHKFIVDFSGPANDKIFDAAAYEKFLVDSIKVEGKTGQLGDDVKIAKEKEGQLSITSQIPFSKRYLKYLTKKFLKKNLMREWLRVVATDKNTYTLKFYNVAFDGADEEDAE
ncbi:BZ3500_MvSof-1268-A1-R1_Chr8-1g09759 [Microbotryum saponariae]|uniref:BZ3500_MvSof-1268-A1-R1_Chr8-1g09759 protein n=1 Tax=Microbotryum saponariae TaxID=289078 RepID=A0A2X0KPD9_9BASI|nr:BZ3500_MvSof-1268-A1-R1_Chr8-1g09759 [Microbotryum saponariae]SDA08045.1 BZ3501_MvSof-1269-A2-R1_Chr8-1g09482 [Microbotryum saponariae]